MQKAGKESYRVKASLRSSKVTVDNVVCLIYLPERSSDPIEFRFQPVADQEAQLYRLPFNFLLHAEIKDEYNRVRTIIEANLYKLRMSTTSWGRDLSKIDLKVRTRDLLIKNVDKALKSADVFSKGHFVLTRLDMLAPDKTVDLSYKGDINVCTLSKLVFNLSEDVKICFDYHFMFFNTDRGDTISFPELVAEFEILSEKGDINEVAKQLDDFLLLAALASRQRCIWLEWTILDPGSLRHFYRRDVTLPTVHRSLTLILESDFYEFGSSAYAAFSSMRGKELLRQAMQRIVHTEGETVDLIFLSLYSALESLVLLNLQVSKVEDEILTLSEWKVFEKDFRTFVKTHSVLSGEKNLNRRKQIYGKVLELNRMPFAVAFAHLVDTYDIDLTDLWPVCKSGGKVSLSEIRNRLIHGEHFDFEKEHALACARYHMQWIVERIILAVLGWPILKSRASFHGLLDVPYYKSWHKEQSVFLK